MGGAGSGRDDCSAYCHITPTILNLHAHFDMHTLTMTDSNKLKIFTVYIILENTRYSWIRGDVQVSDYITSI